MGHPLELKYIPLVDRLIRTCHRHLRVPANLDVTQILPKTNNIPSIINNDQRIQVRHNLLASINRALYFIMEIEISKMQQDQFENRY